MQRTITVKGTGTVKAKPDLTVISMRVESQRIEYDSAMKLASDNIERLYTSLESAGFEKEDVKTSSFNVRTDYWQEKDGKGGYKSLFNGYVITHDLTLSFDFDMKRLSAVLMAVSGCQTRPQLSISFTVKDTETIKEEVLRSAAENARRKAEILCAASGVELGDLESISYNWNDVNLFSPMRYSLMSDSDMKSARSIDIVPEDVTVSDSAAFVWEIKERGAKD